MTSAAETDQSIRKILEELEAMGGVYMALQPTEPSAPQPPQPPQPPQTPSETVPEPSRPKRIRNRKPMAAAAAAAESKVKKGFTLKPAFDAPSISWIEEGHQYTVQNPANRGSTLLKLQVFNHGRAVHSCGLYLHEERDDEICISVIDLMNRLENLWVDRQSGSPKVNGLIRTVTPLPAWRNLTGDECTTPQMPAPVNNKRRRN